MPEATQPGENLGESMGGSGNSRCVVREEGTHLACLKSRKLAHVTETLVTRETRFGA